MTTAAIVTQGLTKRFRERIVVDNVDLMVPQGSIFGFLGPNGAGKTTTMRLLLGLVRPSGGSGQLLGYDIAEESMHWAPLVGSMIEKPMFYDYLSGEENLKIFALASGIAADGKQLGAALDRVGLAQRKKDCVRTYSLGMKQRLGIAAALINNPPLIILDEPTNGLDPIGTIEIRNLIRELAAVGTTIFISSHLLSEVQQLCTDTAIIDKGSLRFQGAIDKLLQQKDSVTIQARPIETVRSLCQRKLLPYIEVEDDMVRVTINTDDVPNLVRALVAEGVYLYQVFSQPMSLEYAFLDMIAEPDLDERTGAQ